MFIEVLVLIKIKTAVYFLHMKRESKFRRTCVNTNTTKVELIICVEIERRPIPMQGLKGALMTACNVSCVIEMI